MQTVVHQDWAGGRTSWRGARSWSGVGGEQVKEEWGKMSFGRFPAGGPWLLQLSLSNAVWTRTCNFTLSCILVSSIFTVCPGGGGCGGTGVAHNCMFLCIVKLPPVLKRRAEYSGEYFEWSRILVTLHLLTLVKETQCFGGWLYCLHQVKLRNAHCWVHGIATVYIFEEQPDATSCFFSTETSSYSSAPV